MARPPPSHSPKVEPRGQGQPGPSRAPPYFFLPHRGHAEEQLSSPDPSMQAPPHSLPAGLSLDDFIPGHLLAHVRSPARGTRVSETARERVLWAPTWGGGLRTGREAAGGSAREGGRMTALESLAGSPDRVQPSPFSHPSCPPAEPSGPELLLLAPPDRCP